jgi:hypothetical protein
MMKATTEATKLNFITDHGSSRESVSIAWRLFDRRLSDRRTLAAGRLLLLALLFALRSPRFCQKPDTEPVTEPASPAAAPVIPAAAAVAVEAKPVSDGALWVPVPFGEPAWFGEAVPNAVVESDGSCPVPQAERE